jgi:hypothetical protein
VTVTRALNTATVTNADGSISIVNANLPRFDYANGICKGLLIEEARTNLLVNSVWAGAATGTPGTPPTSWINTQTTGSLSAIAAATYAAGNAITFTCAAQRRVIYQRPSVAANTSYTASFDIVATTTGVQIFNVVDFRSMPAGAAITGYTLNGASASGTTAIPIGTHKVSITASVAATAGTIDVFVGLGAQANITSSITISNIQFEAGAFATSYIPTTTTSLTRNADQVTMTGTNFSSWYTPNSSLFFTSTLGGYNSATHNCAGSFSNNANSQYLDYRLHDRFTGTVRMAGSAGQLIQLQGPLLNTRYKVGTTNNNTVRLAGAMAGNAVVASATAGTFAGAEKLNIGSRFDGALDYLNGWAVSIYSYPLTLTDAELRAFSK